MSGPALPQVLFVGTAKAGTTTIERALSQHPAIGLPRKETFFFDHEHMGGGRLPYPQQRHVHTVVSSEAEYRALYAGFAGRTCLEVGTGYLYHNATAVPRIKQVLGDATRIGIVLRDPVERTWSSYMHFVKDLHEPLDFRAALAAEDERKAAHWDFMWHHLAMSRYADQVKAYTDAFPSTRVFFFEDLRNDQHAFLRDVCTFTGVDPTLLPVDLEAHNPSGVAKNKVLQKLITRENPLKSLVRPIARLLVPREKLKQARKYMKSRNLERGEGLPPEDRAWLKEQLHTDVKTLGNHLNLDLFAKWNW
ncbi:MAG: sulfotransferase [Flavobacteriales bacterium]